MKPVTSWINAQAISVRIDVVGLGVNYKFDWGAIVVALMSDIAK